MRPLSYLSPEALPLTPNLETCMGKVERPPYPANMHPANKLLLEYRHGLAELLKHEQQMLADLAELRDRINHCRQRLEMAWLKREFTLNPQSPAYPETT